MSLFGALFTGVSGLGAQAQSTSMIANNIANVNTVGFKRSEASFFSLVTSEGRNAAYSPGTVSVNRIQRVKDQGAIQQTGSSTDAAISGNGFFTVKRDAGADQEFLYTRSGSFSEDATGLLRNTAGFVLYALPLDANGALPSNQGDLTSLVPADVAFLGGLTRPTTSADISLNLNAREKDVSLSSAITSQPNFSRGLTVFDSLGASQVLTFQFAKTYGPQGTAAGTRTALSSTDNLITDLGMTSGQQFQISVDGAAPRTYDVGTASGGNVTVTTIGELINDIQTNIPGATAYLGNNGEFVVQRTSFTGGAAEFITLADVGAGVSLSKLGVAAGSFLSNNLATSSATVNATGTVSGLAGATTLASLGIAIGNTITLSKDGGAPATFTAAAGDDVSDVLTFLGGIVGVTASLNASGALQVNYSNTPSATLTFGGTPAALTAFGLTTTAYAGTATTYDNGAPTDIPPYSGEVFPALQSLPGSASYNNRGWWQVKVLKPDGSLQSTGLLNFNSDGTINAQNDADGNIDLELSQVDWGNGSNPQNIDIDIERFTQFAGNYNVISTNQNGAELGLRTGVEITREGFIVAQFSNGATANLYKIPLVTFSNENGLTEESGTAYSKNDSSGEENLREAGQGGAGFLSPSTVEASNVDLADEFAKLIVSQRAFSANTKVITTVDQMTQDLLQLR